MEINYELIKTVNEATNVMNDLLAFRESVKTNIIDQKVISKNTNREGEIKDITKKYLFLNYECWGSVPISLDKYLNVVDLDKTTLDNINDYLATYVTERKLNTLIRKLSKDI